MTNSTAKSDLEFAVYLTSIKLISCSPLLFLQQIPPVIKGITLILTNALHFTLEHNCTIHGLQVQTKANLLLGPSKAEDRLHRLELKDDAAPAAKLPVGPVAAVLWTLKGLPDKGQQGLAWSSAAPPYTALHIALMRQIAVAARSVLYLLAMGSSVAVAA